MSHCIQNCWIGWNYSDVLCFKPIVYIGGMNVYPICEASLSYHTLRMGNLIWFQKTRIHLSRISLVGKQRLPPKQNKKKRITAPTLKPTYDQKPDTFFGGGGTGVGATRNQLVILEKTFSMVMHLSNLTTNYYQPAQNIHL